jgi:phytoene dehydrogenase-like protein
VPDAVVVGSGPNGLVAAITLARAGRSVLVVEAADTVGGGTRSAELTLPGFVHDVCSAIHPLAKASPCFAELPLEEHGVEFVEPPAPLAHPLDDGSAVLLERSVDQTAAGLGPGPDAEAYRKLMAPLVERSDQLQPLLLGYRPIPRRPIFTARFGLLALRSAVGLAKRFKGQRAKALFAGLAAHSIQDLHRSPTASFGLVLALFGHRHGWPLVRGGSQQLGDALAAHLRSLGGEFQLGTRVDSVDELPDSDVKILDVTPRQLLRIAGHRLPGRYIRALRRYRYGPGVFKVDWALDGPVRWAAPECARAATVHVGGTLEEIAASEAAIWRGEEAERPFVLVAQQSLFDDTRAPDGKHTLWAYCHIPNGSEADMTERIEAQIERFAPGFRELVLERSVRRPAEIERENENYVGGDINGGVQDLRQLYTRPAIRLNPYSTPVKGLYLCSSSTPPGGGVHGMCGYWAARSALGRAKTG